jgi:membrane protein
MKCFLFSIKDLIVKDLDYLAAALTFFTLVSIVPLMIVITSLIPFLPYKAHIFMEPIEALLPQGLNYLDKIMLILGKQRKLYGFLSFIIAYYAATGVFRVLYKSLVVIFEVPIQRHRKNLTIQFLSVPLFMLTMFFLYLTSSILSIVMLYINKTIVFEAFISSQFTILFLNLANIVTFLSFFLLILLIYHILAPRELPKWQNSIIISLIISVVFLFIKDFFNKIIIFLTTVNPIYGTFGSIVGILAWLFISFNVLLVGARVIYYLENLSRMQLKSMHILNDTDQKLNTHDSFY